MTKTVYICDCCGTEIDIRHLYKYYREIRDLTGYKNIVKTWELCENCIDRLETAMQREVDKITNSNGEPPDGMYAGGQGIEVGGLT